MVEKEKMSKSIDAHRDVDTYRDGFMNGYLYGQKALAKAIESFISQKGFRESSSDLEEVRKWIAFLVKE